MLCGRIVKGVGGLYTVDTGEAEYSCQARGLFRKQKITPLVGDFADILVIDEEKKTGYLQHIRDRKNELIRPRVANVDQVLVVFAAAFPEIDMNLLDRFIILAEEQVLDVVICINKIDLSEHLIYTEIEKFYTDIGYPTFCVSATENIGVDRLKYLMCNKVSIVAGPSGVGKSSLINSIFPQLSLQTGEISRKSERGKHTTRHTEIIRFADQSYIADTPGFTSLEIDFIPKENLQLYFKEFDPYSGKCRFSDCMHVNEPGCAIKAQVGNRISEKRYQSYLGFIMAG